MGRLVSGGHIRDLLKSAIRFELQECLALEIATLCNVDYPVKKNPYYNTIKNLDNGDTYWNYVERKVEEYFKHE